MGKPGEGYHLEDSGLDGRTTLERNLEKWDRRGGGAWTGSMWLKTGTGGGLL